MRAPNTCMSVAARSIIRLTPAGCVVGLSTSTQGRMPARISSALKWFADNTCCSPELRHQRLLESGQVQDIGSLPRPDHSGGLIIPELEQMIHVHDAATPLFRTSRLDLAAATTLTAAALIAFLLAPRGAQFELLLLAAVPIAALVRAGDFTAPLTRTPLLAACVAFGACITINAAWSTDPAEAYGKVLFYWVLLLTAHLAITGLGTVSDEVLLRLQNTVVIAAMAGAVFVFIEVLTDHAIRRFIFSVLPFMLPPAKHDTVVDRE